MKTVLCLVTLWLSLSAPALASQYAQHPQWDTTALGSGPAAREGVWSFRRDLGTIAYIRLIDRDRDFPQALVEVEVFTNGDIVISRHCEDRRGPRRSEIIVINSVSGPAARQDCDNFNEHVPRLDVIDELLWLLEGVEPPPLGVNRYLLRLKAEIDYEAPH